MAAFALDDVWARRRVFKVQGVALPVASLRDIVASKAAVGRPKDRLFPATHEEALRELERRRRGDRRRIHRGRAKARLLSARAARSQTGDHDHMPLK
jgi:hypothetical protein